MKRIIRGLAALLTAIAALAGSSTASSYTIDKVSTPSVLTGLWWNAKESGWGLTITQQYGTMFVAMYTYDSANNPIWYVITNCPVVADGCTGDIYKAKGGSPLTSFWAPNLAVTKVGTGTLAFSDANTATMNFTIDGISGSKSIIRQIIANPPVSSGSTFPIEFKGFVINSLALNFVGGKCMATLSVTSPYSLATFGPTFDIITKNGPTDSLFFSGKLGTLGTATDTREVIILDNTRVPSCEGFSLVFNPERSFFLIIR